MTFRLWLQRHGPVWPILTGLLALAASAITLSLLILGVCDGRPVNQEPFVWWFGMSAVALIITAFEWGKWFFIGFGSIVLVLLLVLIVEYGENVNQQDQITHAQSTEQVLALLLGRSEQVAAASQLKALASSTTGPSTASSAPLEVATPGDLAPGISALRWDLQRVLTRGIASSELIKRINLDQVRVTSDLIASRSASPSQGQLEGSGLSLRWWSYFTSATRSVRQLGRTVGPPPTGPGRPLTVLMSHRTWRTVSAEPSPAQLTQSLTPAVSAVSAAVKEVQPTTDNQQQLAADDKALNSAFTAPPESSANVAGDLSYGAGALVSYAEGAAPNSSWWYAPLDLGAWIALAVLVLLGLRVLLLVNNRNGWGPIEVGLDSADAATSTSADDAQRLGRIRSYVVENIPEPAAALGSNALTQVTTLVSATSLGAPPWLRAVANFAEWALLPPSGYRILVDFRTTTTTPPNDAGHPAGVAVHGHAPAVPAGGAVAHASSPGHSHGISTSAPPAPVHSGASAPAHPGAPAPAPRPTTVSAVVVRIATRGRSKVLDVQTITPSMLGNAGAEGPRGVADQNSNSDRRVEDQMLRAAGYWAAGWILSNCKLVPSWSAWPAAAGPSLGRFRAQVENSPETLNDLTTRHARARRIAAIDRGIVDLESARAAGPSSGVVLTQLAEELEFKNDFVNALEVNLEVVRLYPRYYVARYRAAVGLSMLVSSGTRLWDEALRSPDQQYLRILSLLDEIAAGGDGAREISKDLQEQTSVPESLDARRELIERISVLSAVQLRSGRRLANILVMTFMALRKDERRFWLSKLRHPYLIRRNLGSALPSIARVAGHGPGGATARGRAVPAMAGFFERPDLDTVRGWARSRNTSAQVLYNLACYFALVPEAHEDPENTKRYVAAAAPDLNRAVELLERTQTHPYAEQIHASWMQRDPDLEWLRRDWTPDAVRHRFDRLTALLRGGSSALHLRERGHRRRRRRP
jgi:hypothetical protein